MDLLSPSNWQLVLNFAFFVLNVLIFITLIRELIRLSKKFRDIEMGPMLSLEHVHRETIETIQTLKDSAAQIINSVSSSRDEIRNLVEEKVNDTLTTSVEQITTTLTETSRKTQDHVHAQYNKLEKQMEAEYTKILDRMTSEVLVLQKVFAEEFVRRKAEVETSLKTYEDNRKKETEQSIDELVYQVVHRCLPDLIPMEMHKKIIMDALDQALENGKFQQIHSRK